MDIDTIDAVLEIYFNETDDYDVIADRVNITVMDVANIVNDYMEV
jgi:hypothetical protein